MVGVERPVGVASSVGVDKPFGREREDINGIIPPLLGLAKDENVGIDELLAFGVTRGS